MNFFCPSTQDTVQSKSKGTALSDRCANNDYLSNSSLPSNILMDNETIIIPKHNTFQNCK